MVDTQQLVVIVMMFGSELPGSQSKMRNTFKQCTLIKHGEDLLVSHEEVCIIVLMLLFGLRQVRCSFLGVSFFFGCAKRHTGS